MAGCGRSGARGRHPAIQSILYDRDGNEIGRHASPVDAGDHAASTGQTTMLQVGIWLFGLPLHGPHYRIGCLN